MRFGNKNEGEREDYQTMARRLVRDQYNQTGIGTPRGQQIELLSMDDVYVVWFCKTLQNWKAIVSTMRPDDRIYEVTFDGDRSVAYVDTYLKTHNREVPDSIAFH